MRPAGDADDHEKLLRGTYAEVQAAGRYTLSPSLDEHDRRRLEAVLARSELQPIIRQVCLARDDNLQTDFVVSDAGELILSACTFANAALLAMTLRVALELRSLCEVQPLDPVGTILRVALAAHAGLQHFLLLPRSSQQAIGRVTESQLAQMAVRFHDERIDRADTDAVCHFLVDRSRDLIWAGDAAPLLPLNSADQQTVLERLGECLPLACPAEILLMRGGDDRLRLRDDGLNGYGCSPRPRAAITFSSCTASSISAFAYGAVDQWRRTMLSAGLAGELQTSLDRESRDVRRRLAELLGLASEQQILLTSSGTDAEFLAVWMALACASQGRLVNVVVGPAEVGGGTVAAAAGQHFSDATPSGDAVRSGDTVDGLPGQSIRVEEVPIRADDGTPRPEAEVKRSVAGILDRAAAAGETVLLHYLDASKTGLEAPSLMAADDLIADHVGAMVVVVDAAQLRLSRLRLEHYLQRGFLVLITGSKFFTGPPFSGALLLPPGWLDEWANALSELPAGLASYSTQADFPDCLRERTLPLPPGPNLGLLARWQAALWEMTAFEAVPDASRFATLVAFQQGVRDAIAALPNLRLVAAPSRDWGARGDRAAWESLPTIFTFLIDIGHDRTRALMLSEGWQAYQWLNHDISALLPDAASAEDRTLARQRCHSGQPVAYAERGGKPLAGMRIASGARLVSGVRFDPLLGADEDSRLASQLAGMATLLRKASMIGRYWDELITTGEANQTREPAHE